MCVDTPVPDLRQAGSPLEVAHKQVLDSTVGAARQQHRDGLPVVAIPGLRLQNNSLVHTVLEVLTVFQPQVPPFQEMLQSSF